MESHLLQMRGLKQNGTYPYTVTKSSHLLQMRGLKPNFMEYFVPYVQSHLLQMRGLKLLTCWDRKTV